MIYEKDPSDWRDLQEKVGAILSVAGFNTQIEHTIDTVRGSVEVDVYAIDSSSTPNLKYLCECKHWKSAVPKSIVHSFRTVVADSGAHIGFLIASNRFQSGAFEAAENSNIRLVGWYEFQEIFIKRWIEQRYLISKPIFESLFEYYTYFSAPIGNSINGSPDRLEEFNFLLRRFQAQADANPWGRDFNPNRFPPRLPHIAIEIDFEGNEKNQLFTDYATLFEWYEKQAEIGIGEFKKFVDRYNTEPLKK